MKKAVAKKKRLKQGVDWHGWTWKTKEWAGDSLAHFAIADRRTGEPNPTTTGKWVRVKFVEVKP